MDYPQLIVSNQKEESISIQRIKGMLECHNFHHMPEGLLSIFVALCQTKNLIRLVKYLVPDINMTYYLSRLDDHQISYHRDNFHTFNFTGKKEALTKSLDSNDMFMLNLSRIYSTPV